MAGLPTLRFRSAPASPSLHSRPPTSDKGRTGKKPAQRLRYGKQARKLVVSLEKGDLISIREHGRRSKDTARIYDVLWWMKRSKAAKIQMEKLRERKAAKASRRLALQQRAADRRLRQQIWQNEGEK